MNNETNDSPGILICDQHHPVGTEDQRFISKKFHTPQTVLAVAKEHEPGWTVRSGSGPVVLGQHAPHHIFINLDIKVCSMAILAIPWFR